MNGPPWRRQAVAVLAASLAAGLLCVSLLQAGVRFWLRPPISGPVAEGGWTSRSRACLVVSGFHRAEFDAGADLHFSWTGQTSRLVFPSLDRSQPHRLLLRVTAGRPDRVRLPSSLTITVDSEVRATMQPHNERQLVPVVIPARPAPGAVVTIEVSDTFVPGPHDHRSLGVIVDEVSLRPETGRFGIGTGVCLRAGLAAALFVLGLWICGVRGWMGALAAGVVAAGLAGLLLLDGAFIGTYVSRLLLIGAGVAAAGTTVALLAWRRMGASLLPEWPVAAGLVLGLTALELAVFAHPLAQVGDGVFQVHRAQQVRAGQYFFTSVTPQPFFEFPYPIALYLAALPFWRFFPAELDQVLLLRAVTLVAHALVGVGLYAALRRQWSDARAALACAVLWTVSRAPLEGLSNANLANVFGQGVFGVAMAGVAWLSAGAASAVSLAWTGLAMVVAFLSHFGTALVGLPTLGVAGAALIALGRGHARRAGMWVLALALAASAVSYAVYYSHFVPVFRQTFERVTSPQPQPPTRSKLVAPPSVKLQQWYAGAGDDYGRPGLVLLATAVAGAVLLARRRPREGATLVLAAWGLIWLGLTAVGIASPISMRVNLAAAPAFACLAAFALSELARGSRPRAAASLVVAVAIAWDGVRVCLSCLGVGAHWPVI